MDTLEDVRSMAADLRSLRAVPLRSSTSASTGGTCLYASAILQMSLEKFSERTARIRGGDGECDGSAIDA